MRRFAFLLCAGLPSLVAAQGFGVYEHNTCAMARGGVTDARRPYGPQLYVTVRALPSLAEPTVTDVGWWGLLMSV